MLCSPPPFAKKWRWRDSCRHTYERVKFRVWCHMWEDFSSLTFCSQKFGRAASKNIMVGVNIYIITFLFEFDHWLWLLSTSIFVPLKKCERSSIFGWGIIIISPKLILFSFRYIPLSDQTSEWIYYLYACKMLSE